MIAIEPALIVTYITQPTHAIDLIRHLARLRRDGGLGLQQYDSDVWYNEEEKTIAQYVSHLNLNDVELVQLALNAASATNLNSASGDQAVGKGWLRATQRLNEAQRGLPAAIEAAILGRTLIYQAALDAAEAPASRSSVRSDAPEANHFEQEALTRTSALDALVEKLLEGDLPLRSNVGEERFLTRPFAASNVYDGRLWLLQSAISTKDTVYIALGPKNEAKDEDGEEQDPLINHALLGEDALLLWTDSVAHKAYYMIRQYEAGGGHDTFSQANDGLMTEVDAILSTTESSSTALATYRSAPLATRQNDNNLLSKMQDDADKLDKLSEQLAIITAASAELNRLHSRLTIHLHNYKISLRPWQSSGTNRNVYATFRTVTSYHQEQLTNALTRIKEDINESNAALQAANTAFNRLRTKYEWERTIIAEQERQQRERQAKEESRAQEFTQNIIGIAGAAIAFAQIVTTLNIEWYWQMVVIALFVPIIYKLIGFARDHYVDF